MKTKRVTIRIEHDLWARLEARAGEAGAHESHLVREALREYLAPQPETCYENARRNRVIGVVRDAPVDLSANRKHLKGFGRP